MGFIEWWVVYAIFAIPLFFFLAVIFCAAFATDDGWTYVFSPRRNHPNGWQKEWRKGSFAILEEQIDWLLEEKFRFKLYDVSDSGARILASNQLGKFATLKQAKRAARAYRYTSAR